MEEDDHEKYRGYNPDIFKDAKLSDEETELLLNELENSDKKGNIGRYTTLVVLVLLGCSYAVYQIYNITDGVSGGGSLFRYLLIPVALVMAAGIKYASNFRTGDQAGYKMKNDWRQPVLYLRSFKDDVQPRIDEIKPSLNLRNIAKERYSSEALIKGYFSYYAPTIGLSKPGEEEVYGVPNRIVIKGEHWKNIVSIFIKISSVVVFMATEKISDSIEWEIQEIKRLKTMDNVLFFIPKNLSEKAVLNFSQKLKGYFDKEILVYPYAKDFFIAFNEKENRFEQVLKPKRFIKRLLK